MSVGDELEMLVLGTQNKKLFSGTLKVVKNSQNIW